MSDDLLQRRIDAARSHLENSLDPAPPDLGGVRRRERSRHRSLVAVFGAALVAVGAIAFASQPDDGPSVVAGPAGGGNADLLAAGATRQMSTSPLVGRSTMASVWTGTEMLIWGGETPRGPLDDGAGYDPRSDSWRMLAKSPLDARNAPASVWTGSEMLLWGGHTQGVDHRDGAAFDPATNAWRSIDDAPIISAGRPIAVWTGKEMIVLAGSNSRHAAAYDPAADTWRTLPDLPAQLQAPTPVAVWTGSKVVAVGGTPTSSAEVYSLDPIGGTWVAVLSLPASQIRLAWTGERLLAIAGGATFWMDPSTGRWDEVARAPDEGTAADSDAFWTGGEALLSAGGDDAVLIDPVRGTWTGTVDEGDKRVQSASVWADGVLLAWGGFPDRADGLVLRPRDLGEPAPGPATVRTTQVGGTPLRECAGSKRPPPGPGVSFEVIGQIGNNWQLVVGADGVSVKLSVTLALGTKVSDLRFEIAPDGAPWPGSAIRRIGVTEPLPVGPKELTVRWDGRDDEGKRAPAGLYQLYATFTTSGQREVTCTDGHGRGIEPFESTSGAGLGTFRVE